MQLSRGEIKRRIAQLAKEPGFGQRQSATEETSRHVLGVTFVTVQAEFRRLAKEKATPETKKCMEGFDMSGVVKVKVTYEFKVDTGHWKHRPDLEAKKREIV